MRVAVVHNVRRGGAHRRLCEQLHHLDAELVEICPDTATPVTPGARTIPTRLRAASAPRLRRPPLRYLDQHTLERTWAAVARAVADAGADVLYANPCQFLQAPPALLAPAALPPSVYFCDEPRRVDHDPSTRGSRARRTWPIYAPLYAHQRCGDLAATRTATLVLTNSRFSARAILTAYGRRAEVLPMGVAAALLGARADPHTQSAATEPAPDAPVLSVGSLIPAKGHDLVITGAARARRPRRVHIIAPRAEPAEMVRLQRIATDARIALEISIGVPDAELHAAYAGAFATLYLAAAEPFGLAALEAQACGSPVIVAASGGLPETLPAGGEGWSCARRPQAVGACLDRLENPILRARVSAAGVAHARGFSWAESSRRLEGALVRAAERG